MEQEQEVVGQSEKTMSRRELLSSLAKWSNIVVGGILLGAGGSSVLHAADTSPASDQAGKPESDTPKIKKPVVRQPPGGSGGPNAREALPQPLPRPPDRPKRQHKVKGPQK